MAKNTDNKRIAVKHVRDRAKAAYDKKDHCAICGSSTDLELHHTHSITLLLNAWALRSGYNISTDAGILAVRDEFIDSHHKELYEDVFTLCNRHHVMLHGVYGKAPAPSSADKQAQWIEKQRVKLTNPEAPKQARALGSFAKFY